MKLHEHSVAYCGCRQWLSGSGAAVGGRAFVSARMAGPEPSVWLNALGLLFGCDERGGDPGLCHLAPTRCPVRVGIGAVSSCGLDRRLCSPGSDASRPRSAAHPWYIHRHSPPSGGLGCASVDWRTTHTL